MKNEAADGGSGLIPMLKASIREVLSILPANVRSMLIGGPDRSVRAKKNIAAMFALKGVSILVGFLLVPMTLHYLNPTNYGIWLTLSSVFGWLLFFDVGLGNGMRNKFAEAMAQNDVELARAYVSTTYVFLGTIILFIFIVFMAVNPFLSWPKILNVESDVPGDLTALVLVTFGFFCLRFVFGLINSLLIADQKPALNSLLDVLSSLISLALVGILLVTTNGSLLLLGTAIGFSTAIVPIVASVWLYNGKYRNVRPSFSYVKTSYASDLIRLGVK
ncbi:MAG TPA: polysaccharide biosynthesis protein, partial [Bacteroidota bacterium]|nr:polysaccharide biosynthesis protein [Bacteroidota bacterium]